MATATSLFFVSVMFLVGSIVEGRTPYKFKWSQCGTLDHVVVHEVDISPDPIKIPGKIWLNLNYTILQTITDSDVKISMYKQLPLSTIWVPCVFHMGSCTYHNTCTLIDQMEKGNWGGMSSSLATQIKAIYNENFIDLSCPRSPQNVDLQEIGMTIPPNMFGQIWGGSYKVRIKTTDNTNQNEIFCMDVQFTLTS